MVINYIKQATDSYEKYLVENKARIEEEIKQYELKIIELKNELKECDNLLSISKIISSQK
jgi:hypothetical protein